MKTTEEYVIFETTSGGGHAPWTPGIKGRVVGYRLEEVCQTFGVTREVIEAAREFDHAPGTVQMWRSIIQRLCRPRVFRRGVQEPNMAARIAAAKLAAARTNEALAKEVQEDVRAILEDIKRVKEKLNGSFD